MRVDAVQVHDEGVDQRKEIGRRPVDGQAEQVLDLRQRDQHRDAVGEADDDRHRDVAHQHAEPEQAEREHQQAGQHGGDEQVGHAVALHDAVDDDDEGARRPADLHLRAAERRDQEAGDDGGEDALFGLDAAGDRERHRQRQRDDADRQAGADVGGEALSVVAGEGVDEARAESLQPHAAQPLRWKERKRRHRVAALRSRFRRA